MPVRSETKNTVRRFGMDRVVVVACARPAA